MIEKFDNQPDNLDWLLDRALAAYTPPSPRPGLEDRVRARLAAAAASPRSQMQFSLPRPWAIAAVLAVAVLILAVLLRPHPPAVQEHQASVQHNPPPPRVPAPASTRPSAPPQPSHHKSIPRTAPPVLNPGQPSQERLIAQLLANAPEAIASLARVELQQDKPIEIQPLPAVPLVIEPLRISPIDDNPADPGGSF